MNVEIKVQEGFFIDEAIKRYFCEFEKLMLFTLHEAYH